MNNGININLVRQKGGPGSGPRKGQRRNVRKPIPNGMRLSTEDLEKADNASLSEYSKTFDELSNEQQRDILDSINVGWISKFNRRKK